MTTDFLGPSPDTGLATAAVQADGKVLVVGQTQTAIGARVALVRYNADGTLDDSFGTGGRISVLHRLDSSDVAGGMRQTHSVAVEPDGQILLAGKGLLNTPDASKLILLRFNPDGTPDAGFGVGGAATLPVGGNGLSDVAGVTVDPHGRILVVGTQTYYDTAKAATTYQTALARFTPTGQADTTFSGDGLALAGVDGYQSAGSAVGVNSAGRIIVAGDGWYNDGQGNAYDVVTLCYTDSGDLDAGFDGDGRAVTDLGQSRAGEQATGVVVEPGGGVLVGASSAGLKLFRYLPDGTVDTSFDGVGSGIVQGSLFFGARMVWDGSHVLFGGTSWGDYKLAAERFNADGTRDTTFGSNGYTALDFGGEEEWASDVAVGPSGDAVLVGTAWYRQSTGHDIAVARLTAGGIPDVSFGVAGKVTTDFSSPRRDYARDLAIVQGDGKIVAAGVTTAWGGDTFNTSDLALVRYRPDGGLDPSFGSGGRVTTDLGGPGELSAGIALDGQNRIVLAAQGPSGLSLVRYTPDGQLDTTFSGDGIASTNVPGVYAARGFAFVQGMYYVGISSGPGGRRFGAARFTSSGELDTSFGTGGVALAEFPASSASLADIAVQQDGKVLAAGTAAVAPGNDDFALARFDASGQLDTSFGMAGLVTTDFPRGSDPGSTRLDRAGGVIIGSGGRVFVVGSSSQSSQDTFAIASYRTDGSLDPAFGTPLPDGTRTGTVTTSLGGFPGTTAYDGAVDVAGMLVVAGVSARYAGGITRDFALARYSPAGDSDGTFGTGGVVYTDFGTAGDLAYSLAIDPQARIVLGGQADNPVTGLDFAVARYRNGHVAAAAADAYAADAGATLRVPAAAGVLANDADPDGDPLAARLVAGPAHGTLTLRPDGSFDYAPDPAFEGTDTFTYKADDGAEPLGHATPATVTLSVTALAGLSGRVYEDADDDGVDDGPAAAEAGVAGVEVRLAGTDLSGAPVERTAITAADGTYAFAGLRRGTYELSEVAQPAGFLDGTDAAGTLGGMAAAVGDSITRIAVTAGGADGTGYTFGELRPAAFQGLVWADVNGDGGVTFGEQSIGGVSVELAGTDDRGQAVAAAARTDADGVYAFFDLRPGTYGVREIQPADFADGRSVLGTVDGRPAGTAGVNRFDGLALSPGSMALNYNFAERPAADGAVGKRQTASIGFWHNKHGQALIRALNGGPGSTLLGDWLAASFPHVYGASAGPDDLAGRSNDQVAAFYQRAFLSDERASMAGGAAKLDARVLALALAAYVTNQGLVQLRFDPADPAHPGVDPALADVPRSYGFLVTEYGVAVCTAGVGNNGAAFGVADGTSMTVMEILAATGARSAGGVLYDLDGNGALDDHETLLRRMADHVYAGVVS